MSAGRANLEWVEQFGVGGADVDRTVWRVADNLEKMLHCKFLFSWLKNYFMLVFM